MSTKGLRLATGLPLMAMILICVLGLALTAGAYAAGETAALEAFGGFASYGFGGLMTLALGYALFGLYRTHQEERRQWLESMEKHFDRLLAQLKDTDKARMEMVHELQLYLREHEKMNHETRELMERLRKTLEKQ